MSSQQDHEKSRAEETNPKDVHEKRIASGIAAAVAALKDREWERQLAREKKNEVPPKNKMTT